MTHPSTIPRASRWLLCSLVAAVWWGAGLAQVWANPVTNAGTISWNANTGSVENVTLPQSSQNPVHYIWMYSTGGGWDPVPNVADDLDPNLPWVTLQPIFQVGMQIQRCAYVPGFDTLESNYVTTTALNCPAATWYPFLTTLFAAHPGQQYNEFISVSSVNPPLTWDLISGSLPPGMTWTQVGDQVEISGTPNYPLTTYTLHFQVTNSSGTCEYDRTYTLPVEESSDGSIGGRVWIDSNCDGIRSNSEPGMSGVTVSLHDSGGTVIATDVTSGTGYYNFYGLANGQYTVSMPLPSGFEFTDYAAYGSTSATMSYVVTGPTTSPGETVTLEIVNGGSLNDINMGLCDAPGCPVITVLAPAPPDPHIGQSYNRTLSPTGGVPPYTFAVTSGQLPNGLTLNSTTGQISGVATDGATYAFTITATDSMGCTGTMSEVWTPDCPTITYFPSYMPPGSVGTPYSVNGYVNSGYGSVTYSVTGGALPDGLSLDANNGDISGTPTAAGTFSFTVTVTNAYGCDTNTTRQIIINGCPPLDMQPNFWGMPQGTVGQWYEMTLAASGGTPPYLYSEWGSSLPSGLFLDPSGEINGTPDNAGTWYADIEVTDAAGCTGTFTVAVIITPASCPSMQITPNPAPNATVGSAYSVDFNCTPPGTYTWTATNLPAGLTIQASTGVVSGTPQTFGTATIQASTMISGTTCFVSIPLVVSCPSITISPTTLPNPSLGVPYNQTLTAAGGQSPYIYSMVSGSLPAGLTLSSGGVISGTTNSGAATSFVIQAEDANGCKGSHSFVLNPGSGCPALNMNPASLPNGTVSTAYSQTLSGTGGTAPYTFTLLSGSLPPGLSLSSNGLLAGNPTTSGTYSFTVGLTDAAACTGQATRAITINPGGCSSVTVTPQPMPPGAIGVPYNQTPSASPAGFYTWTATNLPQGLVINPATGAISGTPAVGGTATITATTGDGGQTCSGSTTLTVACGGLAVGPATLPDGTKGAVYQAQVQATGGSAPYLYQLVTGSLPPGLALDNATGVIQGVPSTDGVFAFTISVTDRLVCMASRDYTITIGTCPTILVAPLSIPNAVVGQYYSQTFTASGGQGSYTFSVASGSIPSGLFFDPFTGTLSGVPTTEQTRSFTIMAKDSKLCGGSRTYTVAVTGGGGCPAISLTPATLPSGSAGLSYSATVSASGGATPYTFSISTGTLPPGLTLNTSSGVISGTPTTSANYMFGVTARDANNCVAGQNYMISITCPSISLSPAALPDPQAGTPYSQTITASGGGSSYTYQVVSGVLPPGLTLNSSTGVLSGTPNGVGTYDFTIRATNPTTQCSGTRAYTLSLGCPVLALSPLPLPSMTVGQYYEVALSASGGEAPYYFVADQKTLPEGLTLDEKTGLLYGVPVKEGTDPLTIVVVDSNGCETAFELTLTFGACPAPIVLESGDVYVLQVPTGVTSVVWLLDGNPIPGATDTDYTVTTAGVYTWTGLTVKGLVVDSCCPIEFTPGSKGTDDWGDLPDKVVGTSNGDYQTLAADGGPRHTLTDKLTLGEKVDAEADGQPNDGATGDGSDEDGLDGVPSFVRGSAYSFPVQVVNGTGSTARLYGFADWNADGDFADASEAFPVQTVASNGGLASVTLSGTVPATAAIGRIGLRLRLSLQTGLTSIGASTSGEVEDYLVSVDCPVLAISPSSLPTGTVGSAYSQTLSVSGAQGAVVWSVVGGTLPAGLSLSSGGVISGSPTSAGSSSFTVQAVDATGCLGSKALSLTVNPSASQVDFGDYPAFSSASQVISTALRMGTNPTDAEANSPTTGLATADDAAGTDDEDLTMPDFVIGQVTALVVPVTVTPASLSGGTARLVGYVDWNGDGDGADANEMSNVVTVSSSGGKNVTFTVPASVAPGSRFLRLRVAEGSSTPAFSGASTGQGEVEDYEVNVKCPVLSLTAVPPEGRLATSYSGSVAVSGGGSLIFTYSVTGALPPGLSLDSATGLISGTPTAVGNYPLDVTAVSAGGHCEFQTSILLVIRPSLDFGDLPEIGGQVYGTTLSKNGARHTISPTSLVLGSAVDAEVDGQPSVTATGDGADEDGLSNLTSLVQGEPFSFSVAIEKTAGVAPTLYAFLDWNADGDFDDAGEVLATPVIAPASTSLIVPVSGTVPMSAAVGGTGLRLRLSTDGGLTALGEASDGEVEDYWVTIQAASGSFDYGDYLGDGTLTAWAAPTAGLLLGRQVDAEGSGLANAGATGDDLDGLDDEDGVISWGNMISGELLKVRVMVSTVGSPAAQNFLNAWVDWNRNGSFDDAGEQVLVDLDLDNTLEFSEVQFGVDVPAGMTTGPVAVRLRLNSGTAGQLPSGVALGNLGEVEDFLTEVINPDDTPMDHGDYSGFADAANGWSKLIFMGSGVDAEVGASDVNASRDDEDGVPDDEDGVYLPASITPGALASLRVVVTNKDVGPAYLNVWMDFDGDGTLSAGDQVVSNDEVLPGIENEARDYSVTVPDYTTSGLIGVRARLTQVASPGAVGAGGPGEVEDYILRVGAASYDYGDLADASAGTSLGNYRTRLADNGPRHALTPDLLLGKRVDGDVGTLQNADATADDADNVADEDGLVTALDLQAGSATEIMVLAGNLDATSAFLNVWIDYNRNGNFEEVGEQVVADWEVLPYSYEEHALPVWVPAAARTDGPVGVRFRLSRSKGLTSIGEASSGEVEDYMVSIQSGADYGDYSNFVAAASTVNTALRMGAQVDVEPNSSLANATAEGDDADGIDDEDGVTVPASIVPGQANSLTVNVTNATAGSAYLNAWIDFDQDGDLTTAEQIATDEMVNPGTSAANRVISFTAPLQVSSGAIGVRVRLTSVMSPGSTGLVGVGEVEDLLTTGTCPSIAIQPATIPNAEVGVPYTAQMSGTGSAGPFVYAVTSGALPTGLALTGGSGLVSGTPTSVGLANFRVTGTDPYGCAGFRDYTMRVCPVIALGNLGQAVVGQAYSGSVAASGGAGGYVYSLASGSLPSGLNLDAVSGAVTGVPTVLGSSSFEIEVVDAVGCAKIRGYTMTVGCGAIAVAPLTLPNGSVTTAYSVSLSAVNGSGPYFFAKTLGSLPPGVTLSPGGVLSGTPTTGGVYGFTVGVTDNQGCTGERSYTLTIDDCCPSIGFTVIPEP
ncbi:MAG: putative Ig domain-containing protein [Verrucomicrobiales bacterium]|nr:putative Ig domain-containing protein [Verrucomicrobiales bacterium]